MAARRGPLFGLALLFAWFGANTHAADPQPDARLDGDWKIVRVEGDEEASKEARGVRLNFKGSVFVSSSPKEDENQECIVRVRPTKKPAEMDLVWKIGGEREDYELTVPCIYTIEAEQLKICLAKTGFLLCRIGIPEDHTGPRPTSFTESRTICIVANRVKPKEKK